MYKIGTKIGIMAQLFSHSIQIRTLYVKYTERKVIILFLRASNLSNIKNKVHTRAWT